MPDPPPENASRRADPLEPMETCTVLMPLMSLIASSTFCAALSSASRLGAWPSDCVIVKVFWPLDPRKFTFMSGAAAIVPMSTTTARTSVIHECRSVQRRIGRYAFCSRVGGASSCSGSIA